MFRLRLFDFVALAPLPRTVSGAQDACDKWSQHGRTFTQSDTAASRPANLDTAQGNRNPERGLRREHPGSVTAVSPNHGPGEHELKFLRVEGEEDTKTRPNRMC